MHAPRGPIAYSIRSFKYKLFLFCIAAVQTLYIARLKGGSEHVRTRSRPTLPIRATKKTRKTKKNVENKNKKMYQVHKKQSNKKVIKFSLPLIEGRGWALGKRWSYQERKTDSENQQGVDERKTAVPKGDCPRAENEVDSHLKMELSSTERESDKHFLSGNSQKPGEESRAYNVCSASVSSCMQIKRVPSLVATKTDEFTDEVSKGMAVRSINDADLSSPLMSNACISINCTSGETNNPLTGDLIHDSLSGNKKMKDTSNASPSSEAFETLAKGLNDRDPAFVGKCSDEMEYDEKCDGGSDTVEDEVNVCDICGDTGREQLLATCSRCSDGAEHIYCMRVKMDKLPGSDWLCEECMCKEESEKQDRSMYVKEARIVKGSSLSTRRQNFKYSGDLDLKNRLRTNPKCARIEIKRDRDGSTPSITGKGSAGNIEAKSITKKRALEMSVKSPRVSSPCRETVLHRDSSSKELSKKKIKATNDVISGDRSSESSLENAYLPVSSDKSNKLQSQTHMRKGTLLKSKSFHITHSKVKGKLSDEYGVQKNTVVSNNATGNNKKINTARTMGKSLSFDNARSNRPYGSDTKVKMPYHFKDLKKSAVANEENSTQVKCTANLRNPSVSSPMDTSGVLVPKSDRKIVPSGQTSLLHFGSRGHDPENGHLKTNLSEATNKLAREGSTYLEEEQHKAIDDAKQHVDYSTKAAVAIGENNSKVTLHSEGKSYVRYSPNIFPLVFAVPQLDYIWKGGFEMWENGELLGPCDGIQAHLSTLASPKVLELVPKLSPRILVEKVPRLSTWPTQFLENHATEDNIALYFFAENLESYGRNYKTLLECMVRDDLALRAKCDKVELLIFSSNLLPENSQSWNGMLFLWGVFRGRKVSCSEVIPLQGDVNQVDSILKGGESEQRPDVDFISRLQGSKRYSTESLRVDKEPDHKRAKSCLSGMHEINGAGGTKYPEKAFSFQINGLGPGVTGQGQGLKCDEAYDMLVPSVETQLHVTNREDHKESQIPGLELSLGSPFLGFEYKKDQTSHCKMVTDDKNNKDNELSTSLSLSLALPTPVENKF